MIVGNGLIASAFQFTDHRELCLFASGVSNSLNPKESELEREREFLSETIRRTDPLLTFVYFSTCSIFDPTLSSSVYVQHKLSMEELVQSREKAVITRLPTVVGLGGNPRTLINYLENSIKGDQLIELQSKSVRYLIDVSDVRDVLLHQISNGFLGKLVISPKYPVRLPDLLSELEKIIGKKAHVKVSDAGGSFGFDCAEALWSSTQLNLGLDDARYWQEVLRRNLQDIRDSPIGTKS